MGTASDGHRGNPVRIGQRVIIQSTETPKWTGLHGVIVEFCGDWANIKFPIRDGKNSICAEFHNSELILL